MIIEVRQFFNNFNCHSFPCSCNNNNGNDWFTPERKKEITLAVNEMRFFHKMIRRAALPLLAKLPLKHSTTKAVKKHFVVMHGG